MAVLLLEASHPCQDKVGFLQVVAGTARSVHGTLNGMYKDSSKGIYKGSFTGDL